MLRNNAGFAWDDDLAEVLGFGVRAEPADHRAVFREPATAVSCPYSLKALCARWRRTGPDLLNDLPTAVGLAFEDDYVAAFGSDLGVVGDGG